jgi:hypothetical protein
MIRLLEFLRFAIQMRRRWTPLLPHFRDRERVTSGGPPASNMIAAAYLRAAHAYMLISMPTGTSTIFGAFHAILALLVNRTNSARPQANGEREVSQRNIFSCCVARGIHLIVWLNVKPKTDQQVQINLHQSERRPRFDIIGQLPDNETVRSPEFLNLSPQSKWILTNATLFLQHTHRRRVDLRPRR